MIKLMESTTSHSKGRVGDLLDRASISLNGTRPGDIHVHDEGFFDRVLAEGSLGLGESYMDGWWDCDALDIFFAKLLSNRQDEKIHPWRDTLDVLRARVMNLQSRARAREVGRRHYDISTDLYKAMLDRRLIYSCGYWRDAENLDQAQEAKLDLIARKLGLRMGQRVLDIGCGWGGAAAYFAEAYGVSVVGVTISRSQAEYGRKACAGLPVEIRLQDYRDLNETFDHIVSIGMFEHVGPKNYRSFMESARRCLRPGGLMLLHTIGVETALDSFDPWLDRYIFPNAHIPAKRQITDAADDLFIMEDWHNFGPDYDRTLMAWQDRFEQAWPRLSECYEDRFKRMWRYYLLSCAATFRTRRNQLWQIVYSLGDRGSAYRSVR